MLIAEFLGTPLIVYVIFGAMVLSYIVACIAFSKSAKLRRWGEKADHYWGLKGRQPER